MPIAAMRLRAAASPIAGGSGWNPLDAKPSHFTFSNSNRRVAAADTTTGSVRAVSSQTTGKRYFEVPVITASGNSNTAPWAGLCSGAYSLTTQPVFVATGQAAVVWRGNGQYGNNAGFISSGAGAITIGATTVVGFAVDLAARTVSIYVNNTLVVSGVTYASGFGAMFPMASVESIASGTFLDIRTTTAEFSFAPPAGYSPWEP